MSNACSLFAACPRFSSPARTQTPLLFCFLTRTCATGRSSTANAPRKGFYQFRGGIAVTHQRFVGTGYFDEIAQVVSGGNSSTTALAGSTGAEQFRVSLRQAPSNEHTPEARA